MSLAAGSKLGPFDLVLNWTAGLKKWPHSAFPNRRISFTGNPRLSEV